MFVKWLLLRLYGFLLLFLSKTNSLVFFFVPTTFFEIIPSYKCIYSFFPIFLWHGTEVFIYLWLLRINILVPALYDDSYMLYVNICFHFFYFICLFIFMYAPNSMRRILHSNNSVKPFFWVFRHFVHRQSIWGYDYHQSPYYLPLNTCLKTFWRVIVYLLFTFQFISFALYFKKIKSFSTSSSSKHLMNKSYLRVRTI